MALLAVHSYCGSIKMQMSRCTVRRHTTLSSGSCYSGPFPHFQIAYGLVERWKDFLLA
jgi:hypothetical protein